MLSKQCDVVFNKSIKKHFNINFVFIYLMFVSPLPCTMSMLCMEFFWCIIYVDSHHHHHIKFDMIL